MATPTLQDEEADEVFPSHATPEPSDLTAPKPNEAVATSSDDSLAEQTSLTRPECLENTTLEALMSSCLTLKARDNSEPGILSGADAYGFHPFPRLPFELRREIWQFALPPSTTLPLFTHMDEISTHKIFFEIHPEPHVSIAEPTRTTTLLRACSESRQIYISEFPQTLPIATPENRNESFKKRDEGHPIKKWNHGQLRFGPKDKLYFISSPSRWNCDVYGGSWFWDHIKEQGWAKHLKTICLDGCSCMHIKKKVWLLECFPGVERIEVLTFEDRPVSSFSTDIWKMHMDLLCRYMMEERNLDLHFNLPEVVQRGTQQDLVIWSKPKTLEELLLGWIDIRDYGRTC